MPLSKRPVRSLPFLGGFLLLLPSLLGAPQAHLNAQTGAAPTDTVVEKTDAGAEIVYVDMQRGEVDCTELFDAISSEVHWVAGSATAIMRVFGVQTSGDRLSADRVQGLVHEYPHIFSIVAADANYPNDRLAVRVDVLSDELTNQKSKLRQWLATRQDTPLARLYPVEATWLGQQRGIKRIVVVMAGLHGIESTSEAVARKLHQQTGLPTSVFGYPNDAPIAESAGLLVVHLRDLHQRHPNAKISLVTHSMGGLVSRGALELDSGKGKTNVAELTGVDQLIQVCPPNHGSALAEYGTLLEGAEQMYRLVHRDQERGPRNFLKTVVDGFNEATSDLQPQSRFLRKLNACERNSSVRYSILAGSDGPLRMGMLALLGSVWDNVSARVEEPAELDRRVRDVLSADELQKGKGDGVVAIESTRLEGVHDWQLMKMHHLVWNELDSAAGEMMIKAVSQRLVPKR